MFPEKFVRLKDRILGNKVVILTEAEQEFIAAASKLMRELVPNVEFHIRAERVDSKLRLEMVTESKRMLVAWSEFQEMLQTIT